MAVIGYCEGCRRTTYVGELDERVCPACGRRLINTRLDEGRGRSIGANQSRFRDLNEAGTQADGGTLQILCECGAVDCTSELEVTSEAYSEVRSHPARFLVAVGHEIPEAEKAVGANPTYVVVEKQGEARDEALARADN